jgi:peptide chain release factor 2
MSAHQLLEQCQEKMIVLEKLIPVTFHQRRIEEIDAAAEKIDFWHNSAKAIPLMKEREKLAGLVAGMLEFRDTIAFNELLLSEGEGSEGEIESVLKGILGRMETIEFELMLCEPTDDAPAILTISAGAGGAEACNWVSMLYRMYCRYAAAQGFKVELLDRKDSEEHSSICIDNVSIRIEGKYAYGFLKGENGVMRLIRNSPFNAGNARQTSFAAVQVSADIEDTIDIKIDDKDVEMIGQTRTGSGGQNQNRVASACRIKHFPSGISFIVSAERDYHQNKANALKMLKSKLYDIEMKKKQELIDAKLSVQSSASFGAQIRSYFLEPQQIVKDHRTDYTVRDFHKVLDGDVQEFLIAMLRKIKSA